MSAHYSAADAKQQNIANNQNFEPTPTEAPPAGSPTAAYNPPPSPPIQSAQLPKSNTLTPWARRYDVSREPMFVGTGKSGLTPLDLVFGEMLGAAKFRHTQRHYQMSLLNGFETRNLVDMGAVVDLSLPGDQVRHGVRESDLQGIHPLYQRNQWEVERPLNFPFHQIGMGVPGLWNAENDIVWNAIRPALALASKIISNSHCWPWWDTLLFGDRKILEFPPGSLLERHTLVNVWPREGADAAETKQAAQDKFIELTKHLTFGFSSGFSIPGSNMPDDVDFDGITVPGWYDGRTRVFLSSNTCDPLLDSTLGVEERLIAQFCVAVTLVHETAHAMGQMTNREGMNSAELYFMDENNAELGYSMERATFGGVFRGMLFHDIYPDPDMFGQMPDRNADYPAQFESKSMYPVPTTYMSDLQQESFWRNIVIPYGRDALYPQPLTFGLFCKRKCGTNLPMCAAPNIISQWDWAKFSNLEALHDPYNPASAPFLHMPLAKERHITAQTYLQAVLKTERAQAAEERKLRINDPYKFWHDKIRLPGETDPAAGTTFLDPKEENAKFLDQVKPPGWDELHDRVMTLNPIARFDTLREWTPIHLCLSYLNNAAASCNPHLPPINIDDWISFLTASQSLHLFFEFSRSGDGMMRVNRDAPEWQAIYATQEAEREAAKYFEDEPPPPPHLVMAWSVVVAVGHLWSAQDDMLYDYGADRVWETMSLFWTIMDRNLQMGPMISRDAWDRCLAWFVRNELCFAPAPPGMVRVIRKGWDPTDVPHEWLDITFFYNIPLDATIPLGGGEIFGTGASLKRRYCSKYVLEKLPVEDETEVRARKRRRYDALVR